MGIFPSENTAIAAKDLEIAGKIARTSPVPVHNIPNTYLSIGAMWNIYNTLV